MRWKNLILCVVASLIGYLYAGWAGVGAAIWGALIGSYLDK